MEVTFKGKTIIVTGAGKGIGYDLCKRLYKYEAVIYAVSRSIKDLNDLKKECPNINIIQVDLGNWTETRKALSSIKHVDGLVNNAAIAIIKPFLEFTEQDFDEIFDVNIKSMFNVSQFIVPKMENGGSIVNLSSIAGLSAFDGHTLYSATKGAVDALTRNMALELSSKNIRTNSVNPTVILTKMGRDHWTDPKKADPLLNRIPMHRFGEVPEVVDTIIYLLSDKSSFVNGISLKLDGGLSA